MTSEQQLAINKFLCEKVKEQCWHEFQYPSPYGRWCLKCKQTIKPPRYPNYFSDSEYLPFLRWCQEQGWWISFINSLAITSFGSPKKIINTILDPDKTLPAIAKWHGWKEEP